MRGLSTLSCIIAMAFLSGCGEKSHYTEGDKAAIVENIGRLVSSFGAQDVHVSSISEHGEDELILQNVRGVVRVKSGRGIFDDVPVTLDKITVKNPIVSVGHFSADDVQFDGVKSGVGKLSFQLSTAALTNYREELASDGRRLVTYDYLQARDFSVRDPQSDDGVDIGGLDSTESDWTFGVPKLTKVNLKDIKLHIPVTNTNMQVAAEWLQSLNFSFDSSVEWQPDTSVVLFNEVLEAPGFGRFALDAGVGKISRDLMARLQLSALHQSDVPYQVMLLQLLGQVSLKDLKVRFDNEGVIDRVIDDRATLTHQSREAVVASMLSSLKLIAASISDQKLQSDFLAVTSAFANHPQSISAAFKPTASEVSIMGLALKFAAHGNTSDTGLSVTLSAND